MLRIEPFAMWPIPNDANHRLPDATPGGVVRRVVVPAWIGSSFLKGRALEPEVREAFAVVRPRACAQLALGASTPWKRIRCSSGRGTSAARRCMNSSGGITMWVVPSR